jgi:hypothetical protein
MKMETGNAYGSTVAKSGTTFDTILNRSIIFGMVNNTFQGTKLPILLHKFMISHIVFHLNMSIDVTTIANDEYCSNS